MTKKQTKHCHKTEEKRKKSQSKKGTLAVHLLNKINVLYLLFRIKGNSMLYYSSLNF